MNLYANRKIGGYCYLFPSDHFGLKATLKIDRNGLNAKQNKFKEEFQTLAKQSTGYRKIRTIVIYRIIAIVLITALLLGILFLVGMFIWKLTS